ncbi:oxidoreductase [Emticicia sp. TH156]|uniref:oxidoreductase n=1 Tax=Emticicia sp. TH156 TaxID=2067454 RepID=UPI000C77756F|nr:oxidoreductase [Emticicia sp. TH156]PLK45330.1 oxidoreductase [Emticicia sp. TH156]
MIDMINFIFKKKRFCLLIILSVTTAQAQWVKQNAGTDASFRSISAASSKVVWAGGTKGTILKTINAGAEWQVIKVAGAETLDFRDIHGVNEKTAFAMSAGEADKGAAKIFKTTDGGANWRVVFQTTEKGAFFDSFDFWNEQEGILIGDPVDDKPYILRTLDGEKWERISPEKLPAIKPKEASFAASGTCVNTRNKKLAWINTQSRVFYTTDKGETWLVAETPFKQGETSGIFGLHFYTDKDGIATGGDYKDDKKATDNVGITHDGGKTWALLTQAKPDGLKESAWMLPDKSLIVVGTSGTGVSADNGKTWKAIDTESFHAVSCYKNNCWAIGGKGNLAKWTGR